MAEAVVAVTDSGREGELNIRTLERRRTFALACHGPAKGAFPLPLPLRFFVSEDGTPIDGVPNVPPGPRIRVPELARARKAIDERTGVVIIPRPVLAFDGEPGLNVVAFGGVVGVLPEVVIRSEEEVGHPVVKDAGESKPIRNPDFSCIPPVAASRTSPGIC